LAVFDGVDHHVMLFCMRAIRVDKAVHLIILSLLLAGLLFGVMRASGSGNVLTY